MINKINAAVCRYGMEKIFNGAIVGFSGGADSSAILHFLKDRCANLMAVHINHMIRGEEADRDEEFCKSVCEKYEVKFCSYKVDVPLLAKERHQGLEETARQERYRIFEDILKNNPLYECIVTAHNANDNAETIVFNLARGSGINGLCGIKPVYGNICRPLIYSSRDDIIEYCNDNNIEYVTDSTNLDTDYTRNRIRHRVLPELMEINPAFLNSCIRLGEILREDEEYIFAGAKGAIDASVNGKIPKSVAASLENSALARALKAVAGENIDYSSIRACISLVRNWETGKMVNIDNGLTFKLERDYCIFIKTEESKRHQFCISLTEGVNKIEDFALVCVNCDYDKDDYVLSGTTRLNSENVCGSLYARSRQDGDTVKSKGMTKKLKRVFADLHIPSHKRDFIPVVCDEKGVLAVPGIIARDDAFDKKGNLIIKTYTTLDKLTNGGINEEKK